MGVGVSVCACPAAARRDVPEVVGQLCGFFEDKSVDQGCDIVLLWRAGTRQDTHHPE